MFSTWSQILLRKPKLRKCSPVLQATAKMLGQGQAQYVMFMILVASEFILKLIPVECLTSG